MFMHGRLTWLVTLSEHRVGCTGFTLVGRCTLLNQRSVIIVLENPFCDLIKSPRCTVKCIGSIQHFLTAKYIRPMSA